MNCNQFEERAQRLLDERACLMLDSSLREHATACGDCHETLIYYDRFSGLAQQEPPAGVKVTPGSLGINGAWKSRQRTRLRNRMLIVTAASVAICAALMTRPVAPELKTVDLARPAAPPQEIVEVDTPTTTPFYNSIDLTYLMPVWSVQLADQSNVDLMSISRIRLIDFVPEEPVRVVRNIPTKLAPIYRYSVEIPMVNQWSDQISCTISLIQNSFMKPSRFSTEKADDFGVLFEKSFHDFC